MPQPPAARGHLLPFGIVPSARGVTCQVMPHDRHVSDIGAG
ncbi:MAG: hypothetical protein M0030_27110 [Actinomycetota bacterium]|nr:hypothetical protein [Actinomycetota bacterium]